MPNSGKPDFGMGEGTSPTPLHSAFVYFRQNRVR